MAAALAVGAPAPEFHLARDGGGAISLADFKNRKLVLYFYPKADTPGCTVESCEFRDHAKDFAILRVIGMCGGRRLNKRR